VGKGWEGGREGGEYLLLTPRYNHHTDRGLWLRCAGQRELLKKPVRHALVRPCPPSLLPSPPLHTLSYNLPFPPSLPPSLLFSQLRGPRDLEEGVVREARGHVVHRHHHLHPTRRVRRCLPSCPPSLPPSLVQLFVWVVA